MYKLFFEDSSILFTTSAVKGCNEVIRLNDNDMVSLAKMLEKLENNKHLCVECNDPEAAFQHFSKNFRVVEAAGGVVVSAQGSLLMIFRNGRWDLPKGHVESGEEFDVAAVREVEEETGVGDLRTERLLTKSYHTYRLNGEWVMKRTWWYKMSVTAEQSPVPQEGEQITKAEWVGEDRLDEYAANSYASIRHVIGKAMKNTVKQ